jgi:hypothetical protein
MQLPHLLLAGLALFTGAALAASKPDGQPTRSDVCGECHRDIYRMWHASAHARSLEDPVFLDVYRATQAREGSEVTKVCLTCHAPAATLFGDLELSRKITWEGVSCDICHGITSVDMTDKGPRIRYDIGPVKRGPIRDADSMAHEVAFSEVHTSALLCVGCHEYVSPEGTPIMTTFSEWQRSAAAASGQSCQDCHMTRTRADVVDPKVRRIPDAPVNLHEVPGGHSIEQLNRALAVAIEPRRSGGELALDVALTNRGAGHAVPTGMPSRRIVLGVKVRTSDGATFEEHRIYGETFTGASGQQIGEDGGYFTPGVKLASDTRIQSGEKRSESFRFAVAPAATAFVTVKLNYEHSPNGTEQNRIWITFYSMDRTVGPTGS